MIARALAQDGDIIILDEPNAHLDLNNRVEIMRLLKDLSRKTDKAILIATHELDLALQTADRLWLAANSGKITNGVPEDLVLNGELDKTFKMKGFDLKTGKIIFKKKSSIQIDLQGEGHNLLWTKNALEREGFFIDPQNADISIKINSSDNAIRWVIDFKDSKEELNSIESLLKSLNSKIKNF